MKHLILVVILILLALFIIANILPSSFFEQEKEEIDNNERVTERNITMNENKMSFWTKKRLQMAEIWRILVQAIEGWRK